MQAKTASTLLVLLGSIDCLTTIAGIIYVGAVESNPFLSGLARSNLPVFTTLKLGAAFGTGFLFYLAYRILNREGNQHNRSWRAVGLVLKVAYTASLVFLVFVVLNNVWVLMTRV